MKASTKVKNGKGQITITDPTGKHADFTMSVDETNPAKLKQQGDKEAKRVMDLYDAYENVKGLLNKPFVLPLHIKVAKRIG